MQIFIVFSQKIPTLYNQAGSSGGKKKQKMCRLCILNTFNNFLLKGAVFKGTNIHVQ